MYESNAEGKAQPARRTEIGGVESTFDPNSQGGASEASSAAQSLSGGIHGETWARSIGGIVGGIVTRMIEEKRDRIREAQECIEWYQREEQKRLAELDELQQLANQIQSESEQDHHQP